MIEKIYLMEILGIFNEVHINKLSEILKKCDVSCIVGAGTSIACGYPGWSSFIKKLRESAFLKTKDVNFIGMSDMDIKIQVDKLSKVLDKDYSRIFYNSFKPIDGLGENAPEWIKLIFDLTSVY